MSNTERISVGLLYKTNNPSSVTEQVTEYLNKEKSHLDYEEDTISPVESAIDIYSEPIISLASDIEPKINDECTVLDISADFYSFYNKDDCVDRLHSYLDIVTLIYEITDPVYGFGLNNQWLSEYGSDTVPTVTVDGIQKYNIKQPAWIMLFSPEMVDHYGRDWLESLPADHTETLDDGGILIVTNEDAGDIDACARSMDALKEEFANRF